jgi:UPF0755 protein
MTLESIQHPGSPRPSHRFLITLIAAGMGFAVVAAYMGFWPGHSEKQRFVVLKGASARAIARDLRAARLIGSSTAFRIGAKLQGSHDAMRPGVYSLEPGWTGWRIARQLRRGPPLMRVTFPEGWTSRQMAELLENRGVTSAAEFIAIVQKDKREGFLFPDTYFFDQGLDAQQVIGRMVHRFHEEEPKDMLAQTKVLHLSYPQIVTLASLVEREARVPSERAVIAGVFYNRLRKHWRLESCATVEYALGAWKPQLTYKDLEINSPYNTYKHAGLPPGPICNPGKASLEAAAHPAATDMMFFVAGGNGTHRFSKYYKEHLDVQKKKR